MYKLQSEGEIPPFLPTQETRAGVVKSRSNPASAWAE
jgi:hypothetical protein